jgi:hypothetical protein
VKSSGTSDCEQDYIEGQPDYFVEEWQAAQDSIIYFGYDPMKDAGEIDIDEQNYTRISREGTELSYVPTDNLLDTLYVIYHCDHDMRKCTCTNEIFQTKEEAEKRAKELKVKSGLS